MKRRTVGKEYGRKPYQYNDYQTMARTVTDKAMLDSRVYKHSEFKKPYKGDSYENMESEFTGFPGIGDMGFDFPWSMPIVPNLDNMESPDVCHCRPEGTFCRGTTKCTTIKCAFPIQSVKLTYGPIEGVELSVRSGSRAMSRLSGRSNSYQICLKVDQNYRSLTIPVTLVMSNGSQAPCQHNMIFEEECPGCEDEAITYDSLQMSVGATQTISVTNAKPFKTYSWAIVSGGGTLSAATGDSVDYTAPASNANCASNPVISLSVEETVCVTLSIAVNEYAGADKAYVNSWVNTIASCNLAIWAARYYCDGTHFGVDFGCDSCDCSGGAGDCDCGGGFFCFPVPLKSRCNAAHACGWDVVDGVTVYTDCGGGATDVRTAAMKAGGCCPSALL